MPDPWVEVRAGGRAVRRRFGRGPLALDPSGEPTDPRAPGERLLLYSDPLRAVFEGRAQRPRLGGREFAEAELARGDVLHWHGLEIRVGPVEAALEALPAAELPDSAGAGGGPAWRRVKAGLLVEIGLAEGGAARRAQESVVARAFDPDAAAGEILRLSGISDGDRRLEERAARLMRDLVMSPLHAGVAGARRRLRRATANGLAWLIAQFVVVGVVAAFLALALLAARSRWNVSIDGALDRVLESVGLR